MTTFETLLQNFLDATWETGWYAGMQEAQARERLTEKDREEYGKLMQEAIRRRSEAKHQLMQLWVQLP